MNYFPNGDEEKLLLKFIAQYQYLRIQDAKYFFNSTRYYRTRISNLVDKQFLRKIKLNLVLDELGIQYVKLFNFEYNNVNRNKTYVPRLLYLSNLGAFYYKCNTLKFNPSFAVKNRETYTTTARRFIGIFNISGIEYLTYHISKEHTRRYINSVVFDIQKEKDYKNIIILADDISKINIENFIFGMNQVLIIEDNLENREKLKYLHRINWSKVISDKYHNKVCLSEYSFCDYTNYKDKYISTFYFMDTEKINKIKYFLIENQDKNADIVCSAQIKEQLQKELPSCNYVIVNLEDYIDKEYFIYE